MNTEESVPTVVLICHERDRLDLEGLASWLASTMRLAGLIVIRDSADRVRAAARREIARSGLIGFADVLLFRVFARIFLARSDSEWKRRELARLRARYPASLDAVPRLLVTTPNSVASRQFLAVLNPDLIIARCKFILKPEVFRLARIGSFALHPGICPEYRNAHGCFWALARRDLDRVGMTVLKIDQGVDTGPVFLHATCPIDDLRESHTVIQYRVVTENLDIIGRTLSDICSGRRVAPLPTEARQSAIWGHPRMSAYLKWKWAARRSRHATNRLPAVP